jgi:hypothetical protein
MRRRSLGSAFAVAALLLLALFLWPIGLDPFGADADAPPPRMRLDGAGLYPAFRPAVHSYVARCTRSAPLSVRAIGDTRVAVGRSRPRTGNFEVRPDVSPGREFAIRSTRSGSRLTYHVRCLPGDFPNWRYERLRRPPRGLFVVSVRPSLRARPWVIVFDQSGTPRWWFNPPTSTLWAQVLHNGRVEWPRAFGDGYGQDPRMAHEVRSLSGRLLRTVRTKGSITDGHEYQQLADGDVLLDSYRPHRGIDLRPFGGPRRAYVVTAEIQEVNHRGRVVWSWDSRRHIGLAETGRWWHYELGNPHPGPHGNLAYDAVHINAVEPFGKNRLLISTRHTDAVFCIERSTGRVLWKLGGTPTKRSLRIVGDPYPSRKLFGGPHDVKFAGDGTLSLYDDATHRRRPPRLVRYRLQLKRRRAVYVGALKDPMAHRSHCCGSGREFGTGWLVDWGDNRLLTGFNSRGRIAFRLHLAAPSYRAVPVPRGAVTVAGLGRALDRMQRRR